MKQLSFISGVLILLSGILQAQDHKIFQPEIDTLEKKFSGMINNRNLIIFTGSSSIRLWKDLQSTFPEKNIINTGFGGSRMTDLLFYLEDVVLKYRPVEVFVYEGDNDLAFGEKPATIKIETDSLIIRIHRVLPQTEIILLSVKPSPMRWALRDEYVELNRMYSSLPMTYGYVTFLDLWSPLIGPSGRPRKDLYMPDSLHLNHSGYLIWAEKVRKVLK
jgi:lysophospholipase L1-like esterase